MPTEIPDEWIQDGGMPDTPMEGSYPPPMKSLTEQQMDRLLNPDVPKRDHLERYWAFVSQAGRHMELTNIPSPMEMQQLEDMANDIKRVAMWDAPKYFDERQMTFFTKIMLYKSAGWTKNSRERDALNESRLTSEMRDNRNPPPKEHGGFLAFLGGKK